MSSGFAHFHPEHVLLREVPVQSKHGTKKTLMCPVSDIQGFLLAASVEDKISSEWTSMIKQSKNFAAKEKYRFFDSSKYKPLIRKGLPFSMRPEMWKRLSSPEVDSMKQILFEDVWRRAFRWPTLKPPKCVTAQQAQATVLENARTESPAPAAAATAGGDGAQTKPEPKPKNAQQRMRSLSVNYKADARFIPLFPPTFGAASYGVFQRLPVLFSLSETGVTNLRYLLCVLAEANPEVRIAPLLPGLLAGLLTQLSVQECFECANGVLYLSKEPHMVETRVQYLRLSTVTYDATIRSMVHLINGRQPETVKHLQKCGIDLKVIIHHLFSEFYANMIPLCMSLRIIDCFLNEGEKVLYRVGLALFDKILPAELKAVPATKKDIENFFATFKITDPATINTLFVTAFDYGFSRETSASVEAKNTKPEEILQQLYPDPTKIQELRCRPEVDPTNGGSILTSPGAWEPIFGFLMSPKLHEAAFIPARIERIFATGEHGWNLATMYRQCVVALKPFPKNGHNLRSLLLVKGRRVNPDAPAETFSPSEEVVVGACLHPMPDGESFHGGGGNKYTGSAGTFVFGVQPHCEEEEDGKDGEKKPEVNGAANKKGKAMVPGAMMITNNSVRYSKYEKDFSCYYHYAGEPLEELDSPRKRVTVNLNANKIHEPQERSGAIDDAPEAKDPKSTSTTATRADPNDDDPYAHGGVHEAGSTSASPLASRNSSIVNMSQAREEENTSNDTNNAALNSQQSTTFSSRQEQEDDHQHQQQEEVVDDSDGPPPLPMQDGESSPAPEKKEQEDETAVEAKKAKGDEEENNKQVDPEAPQQESTTEKEGPIGDAIDKLTTEVVYNLTVNKKGEAGEESQPADQTGEAANGSIKNPEPRKEEGAVPADTAATDNGAPVPPPLDVGGTVYSADNSPETSPRRSSLKGGHGSTNMLKRFSSAQNPEAKDRLVLETKEKPVNNYFWMMESENFTVGGGRNGGPALRLSGDLHRLDSMQCQTFDSPSLLESAVPEEGADAGAGCHLEVSSVELWVIME